MDKRICLVLTIGILAMIAVALVAPGKVTSAQPTYGRGLSVVAASPTLAWAAWIAEDGEGSQVVFSQLLRGRWTDPQGVPQSGRRADDAVLVLDGRGTPWLAWTSYTLTDAEVKLAAWDGRRWMAQQVAPSPLSSRNRRPALAVDPDGGLWLAWVGFDGVDDEIYAAHWDGTIWSQVVRVSSDDNDPLAYDTHPRLAVAPGGVAFLVWVSAEGLLDNQIHFSRATDQGWTPQQRVDLEDANTYTEPALLVDAGGRLWMAWQGLVETDSGTRWRIFATSWSQNAGGWEPERMISSQARSDVHEQFPRLSLGPDGFPRISWAVSGGVEGLALARWTESGWSTPAWAVEGLLVDDFALLNGVSDLVWLDSGLQERQLPVSTQPLPSIEPRSPAAIQGDGITNRYIALGDSITLGAYADLSGSPAVPYPPVLDYKLDTTIVASEVFNRGVNGEQSAMLSARVANEIITYMPQFVLMMEGTNDVTHNRDPNAVITNFALIYDTIRFHLGLSGIRQILGTIVPRLDPKNRDTELLNVYFRNYAAAKNLPLADTWEAFYDYGNWGELYVDDLHPGSQGLQIIADTFYTTMTENHSWLVPDTTPPTASIDPLPPETVCRSVPVSWSGSDGSWGTGVESFDVQAREGIAYDWVDWLTETTDSSATYTGGVFGQTLSFRARARDRAGNVGEYSEPVSTTVIDHTPPVAHVSSLNSAEVVPFEVHWGGEDDCGQVTHYTVQVQIGSEAPTTWLQNTTATAALFDPPEPQFGETYTFRVGAWDEAGNWSGWSDPVSTLAAQFTLSGRIWNIRHEPVAFAEVQATDALAVDPLPGGYYVAYVADPGEYDLSARRDGFALLPSMQAVSVSQSLTGLDFVLPPLDDVVQDGGFEEGMWGAWQGGGTLMPTLDADPHTGEGAALLGGLGELAWLRQPLSLPGGLTHATLSLLVRPDSDDAVSSTLDIALEGTSIRSTRVIPAGVWTHVWLPVEAAVGQPVTLTITLSDTPAIRLDEVSLGSAAFGGSFGYLPIVARSGGQ